MNNNINKNISVWRGNNTPPTEYHLWIKDDNSIWLYYQEQWHNITEYLQLATPEQDGLMSSSDKSKLDNIKQIIDSKIQEHTTNHNNPHEVTKQQIGLGNVDNTSDIDKPISTATQEALNNIQDTVQSTKEELANTINQHKSDNNNPHQVTKSQVGLGNVTNDAQVKRSEMGVSNGVATLNDLGQVPAHQLPSFVDDVIDVYATYEKSDAGELSNIKIYSDPEKTIPITGESGKVYIDVESLYQFKWTGTVFVSVGSPTVIGDVPGTAFDGARGKALEDSVNSHISNTENPHQVTKAQIGLNNVDNTSDLDKPISNATQKALNNKVNTADISNIVRVKSLDSTLPQVNGITQVNTELSTTSINPVANKVIANKINEINGRVGEIDSKVYGINIRMRDNNEVKNILHGPIRVNRINNKYFLKSNCVNIKIPANKGENTYKYDIKFIKSIDSAGNTEYFDNIEITNLPEDGIIRNHEQLSFPIEAQPYKAGNNFANGQNINVTCPDFPLFGSYKIICIAKDFNDVNKIYIDILVKAENENSVIFNSTKSVRMVNGMRTLLYQPTRADILTLEQKYNLSLQNFEDRRLIIYYKKMATRGNLRNGLREAENASKRYVYRKPNTQYGKDNKQKVFKSRTNLYKIKLYNKRLRAKSNFTSAHIIVYNTSFGRIDIL